MFNQQQRSPFTASRTTPHRLAILSVPVTIFFSCSPLGRHVPGGPYRDLQLHVELANSLQDLRKRKKKGDIWFRDGVHEHSLSLTLATRNGYATRPVWLRLTDLPIILLIFQVVTY
ncbi:predicted protein [Histoplasma capsulatum G186AR]|uniref:Uncharacterized protein n=1 Tax=Ajellomyces capsulatus (strain G186AR / H82 / ATCC MYA-2454 / RMSCC 2432) TaxID=447093 RepID=C0NJE9_AJECG|nr:uncharacterized protein HCBG_03279 [Histoplasma capsulatum G186AR]EEH07990.1 predicted protein [Histoplasma capsulatum G186AR]